MTWGGGARGAPLSAEEARLRPLYARVLGLRYLNPGGVMCFLFFEGAIALGLLLALAELVSWWGLLILPALVAVLVKTNDLIAGAVARSAARVPEQEQQRFRLEIFESWREEPAVGRAVVPDGRSPGAVNASGVARATSPAAPDVRSAARRRRPDRLDQADTAKQRARQSAIHRYE